MKLSSQLINISSNLWSGNLFLKSQDCSSDKVVMVDWTHAQFAPLTMDVIHLLFTSAGDNISEYITEALNEYYDILKVTSTTRSCEAACI